MYKDIVVCVNEGEGRDNTIRAAASFAMEHNASLTGLYVMVNEVPALSPYGVISVDIAQHTIERQQKTAAAAKSVFLEITGSMKCSASWLEIDQVDHPLKVMAYTDLIITNQVSYDPQQGSNNQHFINSLVLETGRPLVLIPTTWNKPTFGSRIVLGWDESREAIRAMQDALPLMQVADQTEVVSVNYSGRNEIVDISEISTYLTARNVKCRLHLTSTDSKFGSVSKTLSEFAANNGADLMVIGGYGHTRLREMIMGGVTRNLIKHSDIPLLLSH